MYFQKENSREVSEKIKKVKIALLPVGALEAHGPHLPLGTDNFLAEKLSEKISLSIECFILPTVNYGQVWSLENFPGSISINNNTLIDLIFEIGKGVYKNKFSTLAIINTHLGNEYALKEAQRKLLSFCPELKTFNFFYPGTKNIIEKVRESGKSHDKFFHADEIETSYMLYLDENNVDMSKALNENPVYPAEIDMTPIRWEKFTSTAVMGNALSATKEKGEKIITQTIENIVKILKNNIERENQNE